MNGYIYKYVPAKGNKSYSYISEHRLIMERYLGRSLKRKEEIHHLNGIRWDNGIENLVLCKDRRNHFKRFHPDLYLKYFKMNTYKKESTFEEFLESHKRTIEYLCRKYSIKDNTKRIEYDDLYQEACIKLFEIYKSDNDICKRYIKVSIKNCLIDYIRKNNRLKEVSIGLINTDDFNFFNPQNY